jgi:hypothetical protein
MCRGLMYGGEKSLDELLSAQERTSEVGFTGKSTTMSN